jgi:3-hydroxyisobutyrate dehydrogenase
MNSVAFLGLGTMGGGMAMRLIEAGFPLRVWNRSPERAEALRQAGATVAPTPRDAAATAGVVLSMVADDEASRAVWTGAEGALASAARGALLIECSTLSPAWIQQLSAAAAERGCAFLDAPVTGSKPQAAAGELLFLVGGDANVYERARSVLTPMSRDVIHLGPIGSGARMKLVNNFVCGVQAAALAEGLALVEASGLDVDKAVTVLANGAPGSPLVKALSARMTARDYRVLFRLSLMRKDLAYAVDEAARHQLSLETAMTARDVFQEAIDAGWGSSDMSAVLESVKAHRISGKSSGRGA